MKNRENKNNLPFIELWTDGSVKGSNPSTVGGVGVLLIHKSSNSYKMYGANFYEPVTQLHKKGGATNNVAEICAVSAGLMLLKRPCRVYIYTDSAYVVRGVLNYQRYNKFLKTNGKHWKKLLDLVDYHNVTIQHTKGHAGVEENEIPHMLAYGSAKYLTCYDGTEESLEDAYEKAKEFKTTTTKLNRAQKGGSKKSNRQG